jgi:hypothetical protein
MTNLILAPEQLGGRKRLQFSPFCGQLKVMSPSRSSPVNAFKASRFVPNYDLNTAVEEAVTL